jgi:hypothetical protein
MTERNVMNLWREIFPWEMHWPSTILLYPKYVQTLFYFYLISTLLAFVLYAYQIYELIAQSASIAVIPYAFLIQLQNLAYVLIPYLSYYYCKDFILSKSLRRLFEEIREHDKYHRVKYRAVSNLNIFLLLFAIIIYCATLPLDPVFLVLSIIFSMSYFFPLCWAYTFNICIMDAFCMRARYFSSQLKLLTNDTNTAFELIDPETISCLRVRGDLENQLPIRRSQIQEKLILTTETMEEELLSDVLSDGGKKPVTVLKCGHDERATRSKPNSALEARLTSINLQLSHSEIDSSDTLISLIRKRYLRDTRDCLNFSQQCGKYLLFLFGSSIIFAIATVWGIYVNKNSTISTFPFLVISLGLLAQLGLSIAGANGAGHLVCRDISQYLLTNPDPTQEKECLLLLECMQFSKIEIPFVGGFALRSKTIFTILGSIVGAVIPGLLLKGR